MISNFRHHMPGSHHFLGNGKMVFRDVWPLPGTVWCENIRKQNVFGIWALPKDVISGALLDAILTFILRSFRVVFRGGPWRWEYSVCALPYFRVNYSFNSIMEAAGWTEMMPVGFHWIPVFDIFKTIIFKTTTPDRPQRLGNEIRIKEYCETIVMSEKLDDMMY